MTLCVMPYEKEIAKRVLKAFVVVIPKEDDTDYEIYSTELSLGHPTVGVIPNEGLAEPSLLLV